MIDASNLPHSVESHVMKSALLLVALGLSALAIACGEDEPDRVVGVTRKCQVAVSNSVPDRLPTLTIGRGAPDYKLVEMKGDDCDKHRTQEDYLEVVVRSSKGGSYTVEVDPETKVRVGDDWP